MSHYTQHLAHAQTSLDAAMKKAGVGGMAKLHVATMPRRHSMPFGVAVYGLESDTVDRAARWVKAWGLKHGFVGRDGGKVVTAQEMFSGRVVLGEAPKQEGVVRAFVVFDVEVYD